MTSGTYQEIQNWNKMLLPMQSYGIGTILMHHLYYDSSFGHLWYPESELIRVGYADICIAFSDSPLGT